MNSIKGWVPVANYSSSQIGKLISCEFEYWNGFGLNYRQDLEKVFYVTGKSIIFKISGYIATSAVVVDRETGSYTVLQPPGQETLNNKNVTELLPFLISEEFESGRLNLSSLKNNAVIVFMPYDYTWPYDGWDLF